MEMDLSSAKKPRAIQRAFQRLGYGRDRNMFWSWYRPRNFGDWIGPYLFLKMTGLKPQWISPRRRNGLTYYMTVGSILRHLVIDDEAIVWGSGIISKGDQFARPFVTHAVRGPQTRARMHDLGYECPAVYGDPAVLLPNYFAAPEIEVKHRVGIIPHYFDLPAVQKLAARDVRVIDVTRPIEEVVSDILSCEWTISSSLHGIIVSHAYGVPSVWARSLVELHGDNVKFLDYLEGAGHDGVSASDVDFSASSKTLFAYRDFATRPDLEAQKASLLEACPFATEAML
ncbi:polysaccharide pyruvyl transferase family protein [Ferrimonas balearica]|nr:polysaccharide pyruvyl transferase family protein [Ferrimonas balearica]